MHNLSIVPSILLCSNLTLSFLILAAAFWNILMYLCRQRICKSLIVLLYFFITLNQIAWITRQIILVTQPENEAHICDSKSTNQIYETICATQDIAFEGTIVMFILTGLNLTISLQLINEEYDLIGARQKKYCLRVLGFALFFLNFALVILFWLILDNLDLEAYVMLGFYLVQDVINIFILVRCNATMR